MGVPWKMAQMPVRKIPCELRTCVVNPDRSLLQHKPRPWGKTNCNPCGCRFAPVVKIHTGHGLIISTFQDEILTLADQVVADKMFAHNVNEVVFRDEI